MVSTYMSIIFLTFYIAQNGKCIQSKASTIIILHTEYKKNNVDT